MARYTFFSFSYADVKNFRVNVVRNSWLHHTDDATFYDASIWEDGQTKNSEKLRQLIDNGLHGTSVTAVLIGTDTAFRRWVIYELVKSFARGNGILGVHINRIKCKDGTICKRGVNPLDRIGVEVSKDGRSVYFYQLINGRWISYRDLPNISNKISNSVYFENTRSVKDFGQFYTFSDMFDTYCWKNDEGYKNYCYWVEEAAINAGR